MIKQINCFYVNQVLIIINEFLFNEWRYLCWLWWIDKKNIPLRGLTEMDSSWLTSLISFLDVFVVWVKLPYPFWKFNCGNLFFSGLKFQNKRSETKYAVFEIQELKLCVYSNIALNNIIWKLKKVKLSCLYFKFSSIKFPCIIW